VDAHPGSLRFGCGSAALEKNLMQLTGLEPSFEGSIIFAQQKKDVLNRFVFKH